MSKDYTIQESLESLEQILGISFTPKQKIEVTEVLQDLYTFEDKATNDHWYEVGKEDGYDNGYDNGYSEGYEEGLNHK